MEFANIIVGFLTAITPQEWTIWGITSFLTITAVRGLFSFAMLMKLPKWIADSKLPVNLKQLLLGIVLALLIAYVYRHRRRFRIAWLRLWPSPGMTLLFAGATIIFAFVPLVGHEPLWMAIMGDHYHRIVKLAVEEFILGRSQIMYDGADVAQAA